MIEKLIGKIYTWSMKRALKRTRNKQKTEVEKKREQFYLQLNSLYQFVQWLNTKGFRSRRERKTFWKAVIDNEKLLPNAIEQLMKRYTSNKDSDIKLQENKSISQQNNEKETE